MGSEVAEREITWIEILECIRILGRGKAAGVDDLPAEFYKLATTEEDRAAPSSPLAKATWKLILSVWEEEILPEKWNLSVVVSVPKKEDFQRQVEPLGRRVPG